ncbi:gibberellin 20-oxidase [Fusarium sp. NRRL 52700]|nr:gibberellin 20-oxidase [Fusarium sp. NRRL 52700]
MPSAIDSIPITSMETINFSALERRDAKEIEKLMAASRTAGFFYLDFDHSGAAGLPEKKKEVINAMKEYFSQPDEIKQFDSKGVPTRGYVKKGTFTAVDPKLPDESFEHLAIGTHDLGTNLASTLPALFKRAGTLIPDYVALCERLVDVLLDCYSQALGVPGQFLRYHDHEKSSETILAMLSYPGKLTHQKHTDLGSLTILFSDEWGLQVVEPSSGNWEWVEPREKDAVINVGDALRFLSDKTLYSCVHRVVRDGRASDEGHRYSIAYLLRPADDVAFVDADGSNVTAQSLASIKYKAYSADHAEQEKNMVLTGGMEQVLGVRT